MSSVDPQVQASAVTAIGSALFGSAGTGLFAWLKGKRRTSQDQRCERICANMVAAMDAMLTAMEALGGTKPGLNNAIVNVRVQLEHAKQYLNGTEVEG